MILGLGERQTFLASDIPAILPYTRQMLFLEDGEFAVLSEDGVQIFDADGRPLERDRQADPVGSGLGGEGRLRPLHAEGDLRAAPRHHRHHRHALCRKTRRRRSRRDRPDSPSASTGSPHPSRRLRHRVHACMVGKYLLEQLAGIPAEVDLAQRVPLPQPDPRRHVPRHRRLAVGRDRRHARRAARGASEQGAGASRSATCADRPSPARRDDGSTPTPAPRSASRPRRPSPPRSSRSTCWRLKLGTRAAASREDAAGASHRDLAAAARSSSMCSASTSRDRDDRAEVLRTRRTFSSSAAASCYPDRARGRAQAQGDLLHPRRGLRGRRDEARPDRPHRRGHARRRDRQRDCGLRQGDLQPRGGPRPRRRRDRDRDARATRRSPTRSTRSSRIPDLGEYLTSVLAAVPLQLLAYHVAVLKGTRRRPAAEPREERHGRVTGAALSRPHPSITRGLSPGTDLRIPRRQFAVQAQ